MSVHQNRMTGLIERFGDSVDIGGKPKKAILAILSRSFAFTLIPSAEVEASVRPMRLAYLPWDDDVAVNDEVSWDGIDYLVKKVISTRFRNETIVKLAVLG